MLCLRLRLIGVSVTFYDCEVTCSGCSVILLNFRATLVFGDQIEFLFRNRCQFGSQPLTFLR